ncbi:uncharacterized protein [Lolium perenne]|uniref:uncharacterized protein n=1 Tax=Lolium perenne TaxID=4522 RepID=UPI003A9A28D6
MPDNVNDTTIVLIPKKSDLEELKDFRPISLCKDIVSPTQSSFIPGRLITDNAFVAFECIHAIQNGSAQKKEFCAYKLDMAKAYDRVDWGFLERVLVKLGFHSQWIRKEIEDGALQELHICRRAPGVSHLLFADDSLLFFKGSINQATVIKSVLDKYEKGTGQLLDCYAVLACTRAVVLFCSAMVPAPAVLSCCAMPVLLLCEIAKLCAC